MSRPFTSLMGLEVTMKVRGAMMQDTIERSLTLLPAVMSELANHWPTQAGGSVIGQSGSPCDTTWRATDT